MITAHAYDEDGDELTDVNITITSDNPSVLLLSPTGTATANAVGNATITAQAEEVTATTTISVTPASTAPKGITWEMLPPRSPQAIYAITGHGNDLYAMPGFTGGGYAPQQPDLLSSQDGGETWRPVYSEGACVSSGSDLAADASRAGRLLRSCASNLSVSTDYGWTWRRTHTQAGGGSFSIHPASNGFVTFGNQLYSTDAGETWVATGASGTLTVSNQDSRYWIDRATANTVLISEDLGLTWASPALPDRPDRGDARCTANWSWRDVAVSATGVLALEGQHSCVWALPGQRYLHALFVSEDRGVTWEPRLQFEDDSSQWGPTGSAIVFGMNNSTLYRMPYTVSVSDGIQVSRDGGRTWQQVDIPDSIYRHLFQLDPTRDGRLVAATSTTPRRYYFSRDYGNTWSDAPQAGSIERIGERWFAISESGAVAASDNFFENATAFNPVGFTSAGGPSVVPHLVTAGELRTSTGMLSPDSGFTWSTGGRDWTTMAQSPAAPSRWYYSTSAGRVWRSDNDGATSQIAGHTPYYDPVLQFAPSHSDPNVVYAKTTTGIYRSDDAGATWHWASYGLEHVDYVSDLIVDPTDHNTLYVSNHDVQKSVDGGQSWFHPDPRARFGESSIPALAITSDGSTLFAATSSSAVYRSLDSGQSWEWVTTGLKTHSVRDVEIDPSDDNVVYLATFGGIYKSTDKGSSWVNASQHVFTPYIASLALSPDGHTIYASTSHHWIYRGQPSSSTGTLFPASFLNQVINTQDANAR